MKIIRRNNGLVSAKAKMRIQKKKRRSHWQSPIYRERPGRAEAGSVFLMTVFVIALLAVLTMGILQMSTEEIQLMQNQLYATQAIEVAEAGLNDAFAQIWTDSSWTTGFTGKSFPDYGTYDVTVTGTLPNRTITSTATTSQGFVARVEADVTIGSSSPYAIRIDNLRINE
jgi:Tfp pilus assembly protein PilX